MKNQRITVRLNEKAAAILAQEHARGISTTELVNQALIGIETSPVMERLTKRNKSELFRKSNLVRICFLLYLFELILKKLPRATKRLLSAFLKYYAFFEYLGKMIFDSSDEEISPFSYLCHSF